MGDPGQTVVVIDDESGVGMIFSKILGEHGYAIRHFPSVEESLPFLQANRGIEIVFLDIRLPGMDGISAIPKFLRLNPAISIVMMTAYQTVESVLKAVKSGAVDYLIKPLSPEMVLQAVEKYGASSASAIVQKKSGAIENASIAEKEPEETEFLANSSLMKDVLSVADKFASSDGNILVMGESGTGKEMLAHYIHEHSPRRKKPFIVVDCAAIPESLFESELFGYEKGAFTGADTPKAGRFELANGGTLFLDEIGNVSPHLQAKLLRFTEDRTISRLGGKRTMSLDLRLISATNVELRKSTEKNSFREDLYFRLSTLSIHLPPFRNRPKEEKEFMIKHFIQEHIRKLKKQDLRLSDQSHDLILNYLWPGNVRELESALYSAILLCDGLVLEPRHFPVGIQSYFNYKSSSSVSGAKDKTLKEVLKKVERDQILSSLKETGGNKKRASEILGMDYKSFLSKLKEYGNEE